jgi:diadenosine tetraphosphate (Ap4A) HIT family hydrolase
MGKIVGNVFQHCSWAIPVKKVYSSKEIIAFYHPMPSYENHIIISPKRAVKNLQQMALDSFSRDFVKIWETAKDICVMHPEYNDSFVIVANGGKRQEVQQVHFHMFTNHEIVNEYFVQEQVENVFYSDRAICVLEHPNPNWEVHFVIKPISSFQMVENDEYKYTYFRSILHSIDILNVEFNIVQRGYSLVYQYNKQKNDKECTVFHIVSGKKLK